MSGQLILIATPIGNLGDVSPRAAEALEAADVVCCEDTRRTRQLLSALGIPSRSRLVAVHDHNEAQLAGDVAQWVADGRVVAMVSDAGSPGVSDPGSRVVAAVAGAGLEVTTIPGPSAAIAALTVSGLPTERFCVEGFVPRKGADRRKIIESWHTETRTIVAFESPRRLLGTLVELSESLGDRRAAVARELTKVHESVVRGTIVELVSHFTGQEVLGEIVIVIEGASPRREISDEVIVRAIADELASGATVRDAASHVAAALGVPHRRAYEVALGTRAVEAT